MVTGIIAEPTRVSSVRSPMTEPPRTPDGRYIVVDDTLWRATNPSLSDEVRQALVIKLMAARRAVHLAGDDAAALRRARDAVDAAKTALGERGPAWWDDGAPDYNRRRIVNTPYADWWRARRTG
jgi:hypothetical protein